MIKSICFFGSYDPEYPRNILTKKAIEGVGWKVQECNDRSSGLMHYIRLMSKYLKIGKSSKVMFIPVLGHYDVPIAWILAKLTNKKIIFDAYYSLYETYVEDRKQTKPFSFTAFRFYVYDWLSPRLADKVIFDTKEHIEYFHQKYGVKFNKMFELPVSADPDIFKFNPPKKHNDYRVGFYGSFMPLHGVDVIVQAMDLLKNEKVKCFLEGDGPGLGKIVSLINKLRLNKTVLLKRGKIPYSKLPDFFQKVDLFLAGPFGSSSKTQKILPTKAAEALSTGITTVIKSSFSAKRLLKNYRGKILWIDEISPENLASIIKEHKTSLKKVGRKQKDFFSTTPLNFYSYKRRLKQVFFSLKALF